MRLFRTIAGAHGGRVFANMGAAFGISDELAAQAVRYFLPPIIKSIGRRTQTSQGLLQFLEFLGTRRFDRYMDDPSVFGHPTVEDHGRTILAALFPQPQHIRKIIANRAKGRVDAQGLNNPYSALAREIRYRKVAAAKPQNSQRRTSALSGMFGALFAKSDARSAA
jgi:hypothetical protein